LARIVQKNRPGYLNPAVLPGGGVPKGVAVIGQLASDNWVYGIYLESPAFSYRCELVSVQQFPVGSFTAWTNFSFNNSFGLTPGEDAILFFVVENAPNTNLNPTGLRDHLTESELRSKYCEVLNELNRQPHQQQDWTLAIAALQNIQASIVRRRSFQARL
jgi:hypothetical protein